MTLLLKAWLCETRLLNIHSIVHAEILLNWMVSNFPDDIFRSATCFIWNHHTGIWYKWFEPPLPECFLYTVKGHWRSSDGILKFSLLIIEDCNQSVQCRSATSKSLGALSLKNVRHLLTGRAICTFWYPVFSELDMCKGLISTSASTMCLLSSPSLHGGTTPYSRSNTP